MKQQFVCTQLELTEIVMSQEKYECKQWQQLDDQAMLPPLTKQQADEITGAVLSILSLVFAWSLLIKFISTGVKNA